MTIDLDRSKFKINESYLLANKDKAIKEYRNGASAQEVRNKYGGGFYTWQKYIQPTLIELGIYRNKKAAMALAGKQGKMTRNHWGENNPFWKGGQSLDGWGHVTIWNSKKRKYTLRSHIVWEEVNQKPLPKGWVIHHINGIKDDDRPENLEAMPTLSHDRLIPTLKKKIYELEIENTLLRACFNSPDINPVYFGEL